jgi:hypothetical protein
MKRTHARSDSDQLSPPKSPSSWNISRAAASRCSALSASPRKKLIIERFWSAHASSRRSLTLRTRPSASVK